MEDPRALLERIVLAELKKLEAQSKAEFMLEEKHLKALEALGRILKVKADPVANDEDLSGPVGDVAAALAAVGG
jgi:hypothetical protein